MTTIRPLAFTAFFVFLCFSITSFAQPSAHYYDVVTGKSCADLKTSLKTILTTAHTPRAYDELYLQYQQTDIKPREVGAGSANVIWDIYSDVPAGKDPYNFDPASNKCGSYAKEGDCYNREHSIPQSWFNSEAPAVSDYYQIFPTDGYVNGMRGNFPYGEVASAKFTSKNGSKLGTSAIAGVTGTVFEPIDAYKGDVARAFFYFVTRYEDKIKSWINNGNASKAFAANTFPSINIPYLQMMLRWSALDPVSQKEMDRNNGGESFQGDRNPFVDHPEFANQIWKNTCPGLSTLPVDIISFTGKLVSNFIQLSWLTENEINFDHFEIERSLNGISFTKIGEVSSTNKHVYFYADNVQQLPSRRLFYRLKKVDKDGQYKYSEVFSIHISANTIFNVYPNPAQDILHVQLGSNTTQSTVEITDLAGKLLFNKSFNTTGNVLEINVANFTAGTYIVRIITGDKTASQKVIINK